MQSQKIISSIHTIFDRFNTPKHLQEHMIRAAAVGNLICDNWNGPKINKDNIIAALLIHDLGNIVKMGFNSEVELKILGDEVKRIDYWKKIKKETIKKYGTDDHLVSEKMANELQINNKLKFILKDKVFNNNEFTVNANNWELKIAAYADQRVGPFGVLSLKDRFNELKQRYAHTTHSNATNPKIGIFIECAYTIEEQILKYSSLKSTDITDKAIKKYVSQFSQQQ